MVYRLKKHPCLSFICSGYFEVYQHFQIQSSLSMWWCFCVFFYPILGSYWKSTLSSEVSILSLSYIFKLLSIVYAQALSFMWSCGDINSHSKFYFLCLTCISVELKSCFAWHFPRIIFHQILFTSIAQPKSCWKMLQFHTYL